jgi:hypothetical protein
MNADGRRWKSTWEKNRRVYLLMLLSWLFGLCCAYEWGFVTAAAIGGAIGLALDLRSSATSAVNSGGDQ